MVDKALPPSAGPDNTEPAKAKGRIKRIGSVVSRVLFVVAAAVFCLWQITFVIGSLFLVLPELLPEIWVSYRYFDMPLLNFVGAVCFFVLPFVCLGVIVWLFLTGGTQRYRLIMKFFYGFELPALFLFGLCLLNMRDYGLAMGWLVANAIVALCFWFLIVVFERRQPETFTGVLFANNGIAMAGSSIVFAVGLFVSLASLLFVIPLLIASVMWLLEVVAELIMEGFYLAELWNVLVTTDWAELYAEIVFSFAAIPIFAVLILGLISAALVLILPFVLIRLYVGQFVTRLRQSKSIQNALIAMLVLTVLVGVHIGLNKQPQQAVFTMLAHEPQSADDRRALVDRQELVRSGLMNAYLSRHRYLSSTETASVLTSLYSEIFSVDKSVAKYPQQLLNFLFKPVLYDGHNTDDMERAGLLYEQHFDEPIQKAELDEISRALKANSVSGWGNAAGLLDVSQETVYLERQTIDVKVEQQLATIRVSQKLVNKVRRQREAVMHFSLPEYAVVTGVWLSNDENNLGKFEALVASRGAAQVVYNREVSRRIDPALLEKVGPELYRLRVFPIERAHLENKHTLVDGEPMFVTFEYQSLADQQGSWPVPNLLEKRHLYWDENTVEILNGEQMYRTHEQDWIPREVGMQHQVEQVITEIAGSQNRSVWAVPRSYLEEGPSADSSGALTKNTVVLIDGSRSMQRHANDVLVALDQLPEADIYFCQSACDKTTQDAMSEHVYWGNSKPIDQLGSFISNTNSLEASLIIFLTDDGSYETESDTKAALNPAMPVWVSHLGGSKPYAYSDAWLTTINQSGGGFSAGDVDELLNQLLLLDNNDQLTLRGVDTAMLNKLVLTGVNKHWLWFEGPVLSAEAELATYHKLAAAFEISRITKSGVTLALEQLDELHQQAITAKIVTELSSMIVLVNDAQKHALKQAESRHDRFDRENENGAQRVGMPVDTLEVAAVPEPHEWALIIIVMAFVSMSLYRRRHELGIGKQAY